MTLKCGSNSKREINARNDIDMILNPVSHYIKHHPTMARCIFNTPLHSLNIVYKKIILDAVIVHFFREKSILSLGKEHCRKRKQSKKVNHELLQGFIFINVHLNPFLPTQKQRIT